MFIIVHHLFPVWTENSKLNDVYLFLFDEFLLITKVKRNKKVQYFTNFAFRCSLCTNSKQDLIAKMPSMIHIDLGNVNLPYN